MNPQPVQSRDSAIVDNCLKWRRTEKRWALAEEDPAFETLPQALGLMSLKFLYQSIELIH
jgi:hypothetical protein